MSVPQSEDGKSTTVQRDGLLQLGQVADVD